VKKKTVKNRKKVVKTVPLYDETKVVIKLYDPPTYMSNPDGSVLLGVVVAESAPR
jgi:hypothetical protein